MNSPLPRVLARRYEICAPLGGGGQATVYRAHDLEEGVDCAVKILLSERSPTSRARFLREGVVLTSLQHPNLVRVHASGEQDDLAYIVMDLCSHSLADELERGALPFEEARRRCAELLDALAVAHQHGIIHRDVKPSNLLVGRDGLLKVADFGIARDAVQRVTRTGATFGTPAYMAPEQSRSATHATVRADLYSVGATFYALLTARDPDDLWSVEVRAHALPGLPVNVAAFVARATAYDPEHRFASAKEMKVALLALDPAMRRLDRRFYKGPPRRRWWVLAAAGALAVSGAAGGAVGLALISLREAQPAPELVPSTPSPLAAAPPPSLPPPLPVAAPDPPAAPVPRAARSATAPAGSAPLFVNTRGGRATVRVDGEDLGLTPRRGRWAAGTRRLELVVDGAPVYREEVSVTADAPFAYCHDLATGARCAE